MWDMTKETYKELRKDYQLLQQAVLMYDLSKEHTSLEVLSFKAMMETMKTLGEILAIKKKEKVA